MTQIFAALGAKIRHQSSYQTLGLLAHQVLLSVLVVSVIILIILRLVFQVLAARRVFASLAAAPPHFSSEFSAIMHPAAPIIILIFKVLLIAVLAQLLVQIYIPPPLQLNNFLLQLFPLLRNLVQLPLYVNELLNFDILLQDSFVSLLF